MVGALVGAAVSIGSAIYNKNASAEDRRKARKELKRLANNYGVAYNELKDVLSAYFKENPVYEDVGDKLTESKASASSAQSKQPKDYEGYKKSREDTYNDYIDAMANAMHGYEDKGNALNESVKQNKNIYSMAMDEFEAERNADYQAFADKLAQYKKYLNEVNQLSKNRSAALLNQQGYANKWNDNNMATLVNLMAAGQQTQNQLTSQAMGI